MVGQSESQRLLTEVRGLYLTGEIEVDAFERGVANALRVEAREQAASAPPDLDRVILMPAAGQGCVNVAGVRHTRLLGTIAAVGQFADWDTATADGRNREARMRSWCKVLSDKLDRVELLEIETEHPCPNCGDYALSNTGFPHCRTCHRLEAHKRGCHRCQPHVDWRFGTEWRCAPCRVELGIIAGFSKGAPWELTRGGEKVRPAAA